LIRLETVSRPRRRDRDHIPVKELPEFLIPKFSLLVEPRLTPSESEKVAN